MSSKLTVIFYIILCLEAGIVLTLLPWWEPLGLIGDWGDNFFLVYAAQKAGLPTFQRFVASDWVRGAVTGLGVLNFLMAFWEIAHFKQTVGALQQAQTAAALAAQPRKPAHAEENVSQPAETNAQLPDHKRPDDPHDHTVEH